MALCRRGEIWWIDFVTSNGQRVRRSTGTEDRTLAQELHDKLKAESWRIAKLGERTRRTWNEAVVRWLKESSHKATLELDKRICAGSIAIWVASLWTRSAGR